MLRTWAGKRAMHRNNRSLKADCTDFTTPDKTLGVRPPVTLIEEFFWVVASGARLGKLFIVYL